RVGAYARDRFRGPAGDGHGRPARDPGAVQLGNHGAVTARRLRRNGCPEREWRTKCERRSSTGKPTTAVTGTFAPWRKERCPMTADRSTNGPAPKLNESVPL